MNARLLVTSFSLTVALASVDARAVPYRHPSDCADGCMMVTAYRDNGGHTDWACGGNTYGGHGGTDFGTFGGWAAVDEGRNILAASDGVVVAAHDGEFDRCTTGGCSGGGGFGNHVAVQDADGVVVWYGHMKQGSVGVGEGQFVGCGQYLGQIASSGSSTGPHLHFEPRGPFSFDPFGGPCSAGSSWVQQNDYNALPAQTCFNANRAPRGWVDGATCEFGVFGWAQDEDAPDAQIDVHVYVDGEAGSGARGFAVRADHHRDDLCGAIGSCAHGFNFFAPRAWQDGNAHTAFAYAIDTAGGANPLLGGSGVTFACGPPPLPFPAEDVLLRHVTSPESMSAWLFSFDNVAPLGPGVRETVEVGPALPAAPVLIRADGALEVWLIDDGNVRRHVTSPESAAWWGFNLDTVAVVTPAEVEAHPLGQPLVILPALVSSEGAVWVIDLKPPPPDDEDGDINDELNRDTTTTTTVTTTANTAAVITVTTTTTT